MDVVNIFLMILTFRGALAYPKHEIREKEILATDGQFPYQVLIRSKYGDHYPICNGILLENNFVLTTAGCVKRYETSAGSLEVVAGGLLINMTSSDDEHVQECHVRNVIIHPLWHFSGGKSADLALLEVYPEMKHTSFVKRAQIAELRPSAVNISGWSDKENLVYLDGYMYNENSCIYFLDDEELRSTFCIVSSNGRKLLSRKNYAGASVGSAENIYGIISTSDPGFATSISRYQTWIDNITKRQRATSLLPSTQDDWTETDEDESEETYETTEDDEETDESQETDDETYDSEETDESKIWTDETEEESEESDETDETEDTDETDDTVETDETEDTDESEESERPSRHTTPTYKTTPSRPSTSLKPMTDEASEETEESDETSDETYETEETDESEESRRPSRHTTPTYRTPSTSPRSITDETSEESDETSDETEETEESSRPTRYTTPPSGKTYRTIPFRPSTSPKPVTDETSEETDETSDETDETKNSSSTEQIEQFESSSSSYFTLRSSTFLVTNSTSTSDISSTNTEGPQPIIPESLESGSSQLTFNIFIIFFSSIVIKHFL